MMNKGDACDVQELLTYMFDDSQEVTCAVAAHALRSAQSLADRSHDALGAGMTGAQMLAMVDEFGGCDGCDECGERPVETVVVSAEVL